MLDEDGEITEEGRFRTTEGGVAKRFEDMDRVRVAMETGAHSIWISEQLQEYGHEVIVVNVTELHPISRDDSKRDWTDAEKLVRYAPTRSACPRTPLFPEDAVPIQHLRDLVFSCVTNRS
jgi:transposase